jgi:hypothetical protein
LRDHDDEPVRLDRVGFNEATFDDFLTEEVPIEDETVQRVTYVHVFTECAPQILTMKHRRLPPDALPLLFR